MLRCARHVLNLDIKTYAQLIWDWKEFCMMVVTIDFAILAQVGPQGQTSIICLGSVLTFCVAFAVQIHQSETSLDRQASHR